MAGANPGCHIVALPYPGRGHINPMLNLCRLMLDSRPEITVSFIVTEEWLGLLAATPPPPPPNFSFHTVPNVIPSEIGRAKDFAGFRHAVLTRLEAPVERLLDRLPPPKPSVIIYDTYLTWAVAAGIFQWLPFIPCRPPSSPSSTTPISSSNTAILRPLSQIRSYSRVRSDLLNYRLDDTQLLEVPCQVLDKIILIT